jgi:hypothetical protein
MKPPWLLHCGATSISGMTVAFPVANAVGHPVNPRGATMAAEAEIEAAPRWQDELYDLLRANDE